MPERIEGDISDSIRQYDWGLLLDGSTWKLTRDEYRSIGSFRSVAYQASSRVGVKVKVSVKNAGTAGEYVLIQAKGPRDA